MKIIWIFHLWRISSSSSRYGTNIMGDSLPLRSYPHVSSFNRYHLLLENFSINSTKSVV